MMNLVVIGEAATKIRDGFPEFIQDNPSPTLPWHQMIGMRNRMTHGYFDVDLEILWDTVATHLPVLEHFLASHPAQSASALDDPDRLRQ